MQVGKIEKYCVFWGMASLQDLAGLIVSLKMCDSSNCESLCEVVNLLQNETLRLWFMASGFTRTSPAAPKAIETKGAGQASTQCHGMCDESISSEVL